MIKNRIRCGARVRVMHEGVMLLASQLDNFFFCHVDCVERLIERDQSVRYFNGHAVLFVSEENRKIHWLQLKTCIIDLNRIESNIRKAAT